MPKDTLMSRTDTAVAEARRGHFDFLWHLVNTMTAGLVFKGQRVVYTYKDLAAYFKRAGVEADEFEEFMQSLDAFASR